MLCIKPDELKSGMKLARPIYNKQGVLLYDRSTRLTKQSVQSIKNFGLFGVFILEPTEPAPEMTEEEKGFERFQTMSMFALKDELNHLHRQEGTKNLENLAAKIIKMYGKLDHKIVLYESLRSEEDYMYKHCVSVAVLCAIMSSSMGLSHMEQMDIVISALLYEDKEKEFIQQDENISSTVKVIIGQISRELSEKSYTGKRKLMAGTRILKVAHVFDTMTQMGMGQERLSRIAAIKYFLSELDTYGENEVGALIKGIHILYPGICVELSNKTRALVIKENEEDVLRPVLLGLDDNTIYDLRNDRLYHVVQIRDILKTMDRRVALSPDFIEQFQSEIQD